MSSFVISKQAYARVGALFGAFTEIKNNYMEPVLYKYNFEKKDLCNWLDIVIDFTKLYKINLKSFNISYKENIKDIEIIDFEECKKYKDYMISIYKKPQIEELIFDIHNFLHSVSYQIDDEECNEQAQMIIGRYEKYLLDILKYTKHIENNIDCWGNFELAIE